MSPIRICPKCEQILATAAHAMRRHAADMHRAISRKGDMTEEQVDDYRNRLITSFNDAQSTWDVYHSHLTEHGILPESHKKLSRDADRARLAHQYQASMETGGG